MLVAVLMLAATPATAQPVYAVAGGNLVRFDTATPGTINSSVAITGLQPLETIVGIDFDHAPVPEVLYGVGSSSRLYTINTTTGAATEVGSGPFSPALSGTKFGVEFNFDGFVRVVSDADQNLRIDATDGTATADSPLGAAANVVGIAYAGDQLFGIDSAADALMFFDDEFGGEVSTQAPLGVDTGSDVGFDVSEGGRPFAVLSSGGSKLYRIALFPEGNAATLVGSVGGAAITGGMSIAHAAPVFHATPSALAFGNQSVGTLSVSRTFTVQLTGGDAVDLAREETGGAHPDDFFVMHDDCEGRHLEPPPPADADFASCSIRLRFAPSGLGARSSTLQFCEPRGPGCFPMFQVTLSGTGTTGPFGPPGPPGPPGKDRDVLAAAFGADRYSAKQRRRFRIRYVSTLAANVTVDVLRGRRSVARKRARARRGLNKLRIRAPRRAGRYKLRLHARIGGQISTDTARLRVKRRRH